MPLLSTQFLESSLGLVLECVDLCVILLLHVRGVRDNHAVKNHVEVESLRGVGHLSVTLVAGLKKLSQELLIAFTDGVDKIVVSKSRLSSFLRRLLFISTSVNLIVNSSLFDDKTMVVQELVGVVLKVFHLLQLLHFFNQSVASSVKVGLRVLD